MTSAGPTPAAPALEARPRLLSLDALRGFDMFWILGADTLVRALDKMAANPVTRTLGAQLSHVDWDGFHFYDLIFPLFVFIAGVSSVWSLSRETERHGRAGAARRVLRRGVLLVLLGIFYSGGLAFEWPNIRLLGVLQRIGLSYLGAGLLFVLLPARRLPWAAAGLLIGYWAMLTFIPIRDLRLDPAHLASLADLRGDAAMAAHHRDGTNPSTVSAHPAWLDARQRYDETTRRVSGVFEKGRNLANHVDFQLLPGKLYDNYWDPEGLLGTLGGIACCLLGILAGNRLRRTDLPEAAKVRHLALAGVVAVAAGLLLSLQMPVIKKIWSPSFVLVAAGCSSLLLAAFHQVIEVGGWRSWCVPFVWIGTNSITVYLANNIIGFRRLAERFAGGDVRRSLDTHVAAGTGDLALALVALSLAFALCAFLHRRRIFLRL